MAPRVVRSGAAHALASDASTPLRRAASCRVPLHAAVFGEPGGRERAIVEHDGGLRASAFTYSTGVAAVRVESDGELRRPAACSARAAPAAAILYAQAH